MGEEKKTLNVAVASIIQNNKILLIKRVKNPFLGFWSLPGGKLDFGEHPEEAVLREVKEETSLDCEFLGFKGVASEVLHNKNEKVFHSIMYVCSLKPKTNNPKPVKEGDLEWFELDELDEVKMIPSDREMIKEFIIKDKNINIHKIKMIEEKGNYSVEEFRE